MILLLITEKHFSDELSLKFTQLTLTKNSITYAPRIFKKFDSAPWGIVPYYIWHILDFWTVVAMIKNDF